MARAIVNLFAILFVVGLIAIILMAAGLRISFEGGNLLGLGNAAVVIVTATPVPASVPGTSGALAPAFSGCAYPADWAPEYPSGEEALSGYNINGPAFFVPVRGNVAIFSELVPVPEGTSYTPTKNGVRQRYMQGTGCDLAIERGWLPRTP